jgi:pseudouridine synthase
MQESQTDNSNSLRLNKYLALELGISRREADNLIDKRQLTINGEPISLGARVRDGDIVALNGKVISKTVQYQYIALNKPVNYVCSRRQQGENLTIYELLPEELHNLKPVGRLDCKSSGLILLTNDGDFAYKMTHPKFYKNKTYYVRLDTDLEPLHQQMISDYGITLEDGPSKLQLERLDDLDRKDWKVIMHEGRNRQIRRTFNSLGYNVVKLHRVEFGEFAIGNLKPGKFQFFNIK